MAKKKPQESMSIELGRVWLERGDNDLAYALRGSHLQAEIVLAWFEREMAKPGTDYKKLINEAGLALDKAAAAIMQ